MRAAQKGFTLVEILVVVVIIGMMAAGLVISMGTSGRDSELEHERDRLNGLIQYTRERGELQIAEYGLQIVPNGYRFVLYDSRTGLWGEDVLDTTLAQHRLPVGLTLSLVVEGHEVVIAEPKQLDSSTGKPLDLTPQIMLFSSGDTNDFELTLTREQAGRSVTFKNTATGTIEAGELKEAKP
jgi:general secretion pathway protein H